MGMLAKEREAGFTYADYLKWPTGERWELIDGQAYAMSPAPSNFHQLIVGELFRQLANHFHDKLCRPFIAPFDVRLPHAVNDDQQIDTVVQPDISVVCDPEKLKDNRGCLGAPNWVIEVLSPGTAIHDQRTKRALYERHGVAEYWLVHPGDRSVTIYRLEAGLQAGVYGQSLVLGSEDDCVPQAFPELVIAVAEIFRDLPPQDDTLWLADA
jgi:Uma2 family endonuclease